MKYSGSCLCKGIQFEIEGKLEPIQICHCEQCRKAQGSAFAANIPVKEAHFHLISGAELLTSFESSKGKHRHFCRHCGSPIYSRTDQLPGVIRIRYGTLNNDIDTQPVAHFYVDSKANWFQINDNLPIFKEAFTPDPQDNQD